MSWLLVVCCLVLGVSLVGVLACPLAFNGCCAVAFFLFSVYCVVE